MRYNRGGDSIARPRSTLLPDGCGVIRQLRVRVEPPTPEALLGEGRWVMDN